MARRRAPRKPERQWDMNNIETYSEACAGGVFYMGLCIALVTAAFWIFAANPPTP